MIKLKVTTVGNSTGIVIPKEALSHLRVKKGDTLSMTETPDGYEISPYNPAFEEEMKAAEHISRKYRNSLRKLAK
ncbi:MAG: AbrB/MazE/SpoVT family DNA-binding domain-containing protein [Candidatus Nitrospinota bacterium M3_3B_026]